MMRINGITVLHLIATSIILSSPAYGEDNKKPKRENRWYPENGEAVINGPMSVRQIAPKRGEGSSQLKIHHNEVASFKIELDDIDWECQDRAEDQSGNEYGIPVEPDGWPRQTASTTLSVIWDMKNLAVDDEFTVEASTVKLDKNQHRYVGEYSYKMIAVDTPIAHVALEPPNGGFAKAYASKPTVRRGVEAPRPLEIFITGVEMKWVEFPNDSGVVAYEPTEKARSLSV